MNSVDRMAEIRRLLGEESAVAPEPPEELVARADELAAHQTEVVLRAVRKAEVADARLRSWQAELTPRRLSGFCAAVSSVLQNCILASSRNPFQKVALIETVAAALWVLIVPDRDAELARANDGAFRLSEDEMSQAAALHCKEAPEWCLLSWRMLMRAVEENETCDVLPGLRIRRLARGLEVRLSTEEERQEELETPPVESRSGVRPEAPKEIWLGERPSSPGPKPHRTLDR